MPAMRGTLPPRARRLRASVAMEAWDFERAERAAVSLARPQANEIFAMLWRYGAADYRNIGHKAIYVGTRCRTLKHRLEHAEPVLRSVVSSLSTSQRATDERVRAGRPVLPQQISARERSYHGWGTPGAPGRRTRRHARHADAIREATPDEPAPISPPGGERQSQCGAVGTPFTCGGRASNAGPRRRRAEQHPRMTSASALHYGYLSAPDPQLRFLLMLQRPDGWPVPYGSQRASRKPADVRDHRAGAERDDAPVDRALSKRSPRFPRTLDAAASGYSAWAVSFRPAGILRVGAAVHGVPGQRSALLQVSGGIGGRRAAGQLGVAAAFDRYRGYYVKGSGDPEPASMKRREEALHRLGV